MRTKTRFRLRVIVAVTAICALIGAVRHWYSIDDLTPAVIGAVVIGLIGAGICSFEIALHAWLRRMSLGAAMVCRVIAYFATLIVVVRLVRFATGVPYQPSSGDIWGTLAMSLGFNFIFVLRRQFGTNNLIALITGRYGRPRQEERAVLFLDLAASTSIAERLGDVRFHSFLDTVFTDLTDAILDRGGEIYRYVGDEVIVTWRVQSLRKSEQRRQNVLGCYFAIRDTLAANKPRYEATYGTAPHFRAALHVGQLVVGEMGDFKREIVLLGDLMNTTSRIEALCRNLGRDYLVSKAACDLLAGDDRGELYFEDLGQVRIRGKRESIHLFSVTDRPPAAPAGIGGDVSSGTDLPGAERPEHVA